MSDAGVIFSYSNVSIGIYGDTFFDSNSASFGGEQTDSLHSSRDASFNVCLTDGSPQPNTVGMLYDKDLHMNIGVLTTKRP